MKTFLIFLSLIAFSSASIGEVTNEIEEEAIRLWQKFCENKEISTDSEPGTEDNTYIYCKPSPSTTEIPIFHETTFPPASPEKPDKVVVFIRPPAIEYKHNVTVKGAGPAYPQTVIYVKNVEHNHSISVESRTTKPPTERPIVYYLRNHGNRGKNGNTPLTTTTTSAPVPAPSYNGPPQREPNTPFSPPNPYFGGGQEFEPPTRESASASFIAQQNIRAPQYADYNGYNNFRRRYNK